MELKRTRKKSAVAALGTLGLAAAACVGCCVPLLAPLLASLGLAGLAAAVGGPLVISGLVLAAGLALLLFIRKRRAVSCRSRQAGSCACDARCGTS